MSTGLVSTASSTDIKRRHQALTTNAGIRVVQTQKPGEVAILYQIPYILNLI